MEEGKIIIAPRYLRVDGPVIFLAGPIRGSTNWQNRAIRRIKSLRPRLHIASPRRPALEQDDFAEEIFNEQVDWEHFYLRRAADEGVILFWLAKEAEHRCDRAYAQTTRFELGEATAMHRLIHTKVVVGIEKGFTGGKYICRTLDKKCPGIPIYYSLRRTCDEAIRLAEKQGIK